VWKAPPETGPFRSHRPESFAVIHRVFKLALSSPLRWCNGLLASYSSNRVSRPIDVFVSKRRGAFEEALKATASTFRGTRYLSRRSEPKLLSHSFFSPSSWRVPYKALRTESKAQFGKKAETAVGNL
jgi:hypothetical protein